jgi:hypothetical protein
MTEAIQMCYAEHREGNGDDSMKAKKTKKSAAKSHTESGGPRKCSKCGKKGHNARSHLPGGLLA